MDKDQDEHEHDKIQTIILTLQLCTQKLSLYRRGGRQRRGAGATDYFGSKLSPSILNESFLII